MFLLSSFLAGGDFCRLMITFAISLEPDQDQQNVSPGPEVIKRFMLNSTEQDISTAHKNLNTDKYRSVLLKVSQMLYLSC